MTKARGLVEMNDSDIEHFYDYISDIFREFELAKVKHPDNKWPWDDLETFNLFERVGIVATEAGEALQAANKLYFQREGCIEDVRTELIQIAATAIRVLLSL